MSAADVPTAPAIGNRSTMIDVPALAGGVEFTCLVRADGPYDVSWDSKASRRTVAAQAVRFPHELRLSHLLLFDRVENRSQLGIDRADFQQWCPWDVAEVHVV